VHLSSGAARQGLNHTHHRTRRTRTHRPRTTTRASRERSLLFRVCGFCRW
jgi:hypothetical protein